MSSEIPCHFETASICGAVECRQVLRFELGERVGCHCRSASCARLCEPGRRLLGQNLRFLFRQTRDDNEVLTNHQEIRLQCGGPLGLEAALEDSGEKAGDVGSLQAAAAETYQVIEQVPVDKILPQISAYDPRPHRRRHKK